MQVIDAHCHLWSLGEGNYPWLERPRPNLLGDYSPLARDFLVDDLRRVAAEAGVELLGAVHVEADARDSLAETRWLAKVIEEQREQGISPLPSGLSVYLDLCAEDAEAALDAQLALSPMIRGVRQILNVHADPRYDYVGRHYLREPAWQRRLLFELQLYPSQMAEAATLAARHPGLVMMVNHAGMYVDRDGPRGWREWRDGLRLLAACPNVAIKLSGFGMLDHGWTLDSLRPLVFEAIDAFGVERCLFASNFPVDGLYASYAQIWHGYDRLLQDTAPGERHAMFVGNSRRYYRLQEA
ncbi:amidohydrolase family protein [Halotalea alkalilenta]|uniref:amidohydrolase family protein n=1 Tax=Halotalea alkalilenta TaxID=376489 RepID=UPI00047F7B22|nr:amidohydrolase family protein [Halotalea alkalilenta]